MNKPTPKPKKGNQSSECLVQPTKSTPWTKFKSVIRKSETHPVDISTITGGSATETLPANRSCLGKYFCCLCHKCKMKKRGLVEDSTASPAKRQCAPQLTCFKCRSGFKNLASKLACRKKKKKNRVDTKTTTKSKSADSTEVACMSASSPKPHCCAGCKSRMAKCLGILCCWNSGVCVKLRSKCDNWCSCCKKCCSCCVANKKKTAVIIETERRRSTISTVRKRKWTRVFTDFPKLDPSFVEHASVMRGAIPVLPVPLAWICLILNVFLPGFGTLSSGIFCLFVGKPRFSINDSLASRFGSLLVNLLVAGSQLFTVLFCLVGWGWSIWWGVIMLKMARKNKRILMAEHGVNAPPTTSANHSKNRDLERGAAAT